MSYWVIYTDNAKKYIIYNDSEFCDVSNDY